ncbi:MAG: glycosyltransferase [Azospirillaceae bacterium]|nr:glycosyltransferase [Azospirillaceae bacterium]
MLRWQPCARHPEDLLLARISFLDIVPWDYDPETPRHRPIGGSQSAVCYLAAALARLGHQVRLVNGVTDARTVAGVECLPQRGAATLPGLDTDAIIVCNNLPYDLLWSLRHSVGREIPILFWCHHDCTQTAMQVLRDPQYRREIDAFILLSGWQAASFVNNLGVSPTQIRLQRNAPGPDYRQLWLARGGHIAEKPWPPRLAYTSTPFRGLDLLLDCFPAIRAAIPGTTLDVFSGMAVYFDPKSRDSFNDLYDRCRAMAGVAYRDVIAQPQLAAEMQHVSAFAYPCRFPETSCIAAMEALASGCLVITSACAALPETTAGFATLVPLCYDQSADPAAFTAATIAALQRLHPGAPGRAALQTQLNHQARLFCDALSWDIRALEWQDMLIDLGAGTRMPPGDRPQPDTPGFIKSEG